MVFNKSIKVLKRLRPTKSVLVESKTIPDESLLFECGTLSALKSSEAELIRKDYPDSQSAYAFLGVLQIRQKYSYIVLVTDCHQVGKLTNGIEIYQVTQTVLVSLHDMSNQYDGVNEVSKLLSSGQFYFSVGGCDDNFSLLSRAQVRGHDQPHFCWNRSLYVYLQRFGINCSRWVLPLMCGSVLIQTVYAGDKQVKACLISRISCERADLLVHYEYTRTDEEPQGYPWVEWFDHYPLQEATPIAPLAARQHRDLLTWTLPDTPPVRRPHPPRRIRKSTFPPIPAATVKVKKKRQPSLPEEPVVLSKLLSMEYQTEWIKRNEEKIQEEIQKIQRKKQIQKQKLIEHTRKSTQIAGVDGPKEEKPRFIMKKFQNIPPRVKLPEI